MRTLSTQLTAGKSAFEALSTELVSNLSKNYMIRYYSDSKSNKSQLIGVVNFAKIVGDRKTFEGIMQRLELCMDNKLHVNLRRGIAFTIIYR